MWEEADEPSVYTQTCIGRKSASSKCCIFSRSLLVTQDSACVTSQLLHSKPSLQQLPKLFYLQVQIWGSFRANGGMWTCPPISPRAGREFLSLEMKTCTLSTYDSWFSLARQQWKADGILPFPSFSIINLNDCLFHVLLHFKCPILPIYCHALRALPFQVLWIWALRKSSGISLIKQNWQKELLFFFFSLFCLQGRHS